MSEIEELYDALEEAQEADQVASACLIYEQILTIEDEENVEASILYAADLIDLGNLSQAEATLDRLEEILEDDQLKDLLATRGTLEEHRGQLGKAADCYRKAHELDTSQGDLLLLAADAVARLGETPKAEFLVREALKYQCDRSQAHSQLGTYLASQRRFPEAVTAFQKTLESDPENEFAREWLADLQNFVD